jgi:hypothetical protein
VKCKNDEERRMKLLTYFFHVMYRVVTMASCYVANCHSIVSCYSSELLCGELFYGEFLYSELFCSEL